MDTCFIGSEKDRLCTGKTGQMPIQEDIKTAPEKLINPVLKNVNGFDWKRTFCEQTAYLSITTTDDQVHTYITSVMEVIHRLPKQLKWDSSKPKVQAITSGEEHSAGNQKKGKGKDKGKGKGKPKGPPLPEKGKGKGGKGKNKSKGKNNTGYGKSGAKGAQQTPAVPAPTAGHPHQYPELTPGKNRSACKLSFQAELLASGILL